MVELQAYIPDDERDAVLDRLLTLPENKVTAITHPLDVL
jgi:hypothetical protein